MCDVGRERLGRAWGVAVFFRFFFFSMVVKMHRRIQECFTETTQWCVLKLSRFIFNFPEHQIVLNWIDILESWPYMDW